MPDLELSTRRFNEALEGFRKHVAEKSEEIVRDAALKIWEGVTVSTPVRTGRARAGWHMDDQWDRSKKPRKVTPGEQRAGKRVFEDPSLPDPPKARQYWIYNNVEYIGFLEHGTPNMAPFGMMSRTLQQFARYLDRAAREHGWGR